MFGNLCLEDYQKEDILRKELDVIGLRGVSSSITNYKTSNVLDILEDKIKDFISSCVANGDLDLENPTIQGESKKVYKIPDTNLVLTELIPSLYSFTHNRYGKVSGTDILRNKFWSFFSKKIHNTLVDYMYLGITEFSPHTLNLLHKLKPTSPFITSYYGNIVINDKTYNICKFVQDQTNLEVVWKEYFTGTMKHNLHYIPNHNTRYGNAIEEEGRMPKEIIRFDWRNPFKYEGAPAKDECIPDDFADMYIDTKQAKTLALLVSNIIKETLKEKNYVFVDTCYFINRRGNLVYSEITPDGMRIKKQVTGGGEEGSFDKDLWRQGKEPHVICKIWSELLYDLTGEKLELSGLINDKQ